MKWVGMVTLQWSHVLGEIVNMYLPEMKQARTHDDLLRGTQAGLVTDKVGCMCVQEGGAVTRTGAGPFQPPQCFPFLSFVRHQSSEALHMRGRMGGAGRTEIGPSVNSWNLPAKPGRGLWGRGEREGCREQAFSLSAAPRRGCVFLWKVGPICPANCCHYQKFPDIWEKVRARRTR